MRILFLTFYYEPDLSAGSFRSTALVQALSDRVGEDGYIEVLTTEPNRYESLRGINPGGNPKPHVHIVRFRLPKHRSGFFDQSLAFTAYAWRVLKYVRGRRYDIVFATSSRLMTAFLGSVVSRWKRIPLYLDIRDIFVDTVKDILPSYAPRALVPIFKVVEKFTVPRADRVNLVSEGFKAYFKQNYPGKRYSYVPNGIDEEFLNFDFSKKEPGNAKLVLLYAGNIGEGQGLHCIVPRLAERTQATHEFWIVGDGGARTKLEEAVKGLANVKILAPVGRLELLLLYRQSDVLFLHLNDHSAFRKVLPSKLFEYAATGKPILAGVAGYAADFLHRVPNVAIFPPCNAQVALSALTSLRIEDIPRNTFVQTYRRTRLMDALAIDVLAVAGLDTVAAE